MPSVAAPPGVLTDTSTPPAACAGARAVSSMPPGLTETSVAAAVPKNTCMPARNPDPVSVTVVPPATGPASGLTVVSVGGAT